MDLCAGGGKSVFAMNSCGGTTKLSDEILMVLVNAGSMKGHWEGKAGKLYRKLQTVQSVVMAHTYADKASLRISELLLRPGNKHNSSACAAPVCFSLEIAVANLQHIISIYAVYYAAPTGNLSLRL